MNCPRVERLLSDYLERLLPERDAAGVAAHLSDCPACRRLREEILALGADLREPVDLFPFPDIESRAIEQWIAEREASTAGPRRRPVALFTLLPPAANRWARESLPGAAAAVVFLLVLSGLMFARLEHIPSSRPQAPGRGQEAQPARSALLPARRPSHRGKNGANRIAREPAPSGMPGGGIQYFPSPAAPETGRKGKHSLPSPFKVPRAPASRVDDLAYLNPEPEEVDPQWAPMTRDEWETIEAKVRRVVRVRDDFITIPFPRLASTSEPQITQAVESYKREAAIVDPRLSHEVTCAFKATALSDLCDQLRSETGIQLTAGPSVADEKVTLFCEKLPLRDVMRQLSRPFGYTWLRSRKEGGEYRYELVQDLKSQLLEEELRNRDQYAALISLEREMDRYRSYLDLSPDEALARERTAPGEEKRLLHHLANKGWGPVQMYFRLSRGELEALRSGQRLFFSQEPEPGQRTLPPDIARGVLQAWRNARIVKQEDGFGYADASDPNGRPLTAVPEAHAWIYLDMHPSEGGKLLLDGVSGWFTPRNLRHRAWAYDPDDLNGLAAASNPSILTLENAILNAKSADDPALRPRITVRPDATYPGTDHPAGVTSIPTPESTAARPDEHTSPGKKVTSADVLEALHQATGLPIVADFYTHLYSQSAVSVRGQALFAALNQLGDAMRLRWKKDGDWVQLRSMTFYEDRLKEVPNRLLARWAAARRKQGFLTLDDLCEIAPLSEAQLAGADMAEGAQYCWGLTEWVLFRNPWRRPVWRFLAEFTPAQRQKMAGGAGLPFTEMSLSQQQRFLSFASIASYYEEDTPLQSPSELEGAALRVTYTVPGWFDWQPPGPWWLQWVVVAEPGRQGRRAFRPLVVERTREAALLAARQQFPALREGVLRWARQEDPHFDTSQFVFQESQIHPTELFLAVVQMPGASNQRPLIMVSSHGMGFVPTW